MSAMSTDNVSINTHHKHSKKKCNEKDKWSVTVGTSCGNEKELFCCATSDGSTQNETEKRSDTHCQSLSYTNRLWFSFKALFQGMWYITWKKKYIYKLEYLLWHMIRRSMIKHCQDLSFVRVSRRLGHKAKHTLNTYNGKGITQRA